MRILFIIDKLDCGGAERHTIQLLRGLHQRGWECFLLCIGHAGSFGEEIRAEGIECRELGYGRIHLLAWPLVFWKVVECINGYRPKIVHAVLFEACVLGPLASAFASCRPLVIAERRDTGFWHRSRHRYALRFANRYVHQFSANSKSVLESRRTTEGLRASDCAVIPNGVDLAQYRSRSVNRADYGLADDDFCVMCVSRLRPEKGHIHLLAAIGQLLPAIPTCRLLLVGDGPLEETLRQRAGDAGLSESVRFLGRRGDVPELLGCADVVVLTSATEGFSNAILEAMASSKPVVASAVGGNCEVIKSGVNGLLVPYGDSRALAEALDALWRDPALTKRLAAAAAESASRYSLGTECEAFVALYKDALARRPGDVMGERRA